MPNEPINIFAAHGDARGVLNHLQGLFPDAEVEAAGDTWTAVTVRFGSNGDSRALTILQVAGTGTVLAFLIGALVCYCQTAMIAELGAAYPTAGYDYAAIGHAIGDWAGATTYIASLASIPMFLSTSAVGIAIYLQPFGVPLSPSSVTLVVVAIIAVALALLVVLLIIGPRPL